MIQDNIYYALYVILYGMNIVVTHYIYVHTFLPYAVDYGLPCQPPKHHCLPAIWCNGFYRCHLYGGVLWRCLVQCISILHGFHRYLHQSDLYYPEPRELHLDEQLGHNLDRSYQYDWGKHVGQCTDPVSSLPGIHRVIHSVY